MSPNDPEQTLDVTYLWTGFVHDCHICYATGDRKWSSGESWFKSLGKKGETMPRVEGDCLCGSVRYTSDAEPAAVPAA
jgi:hypothetical protein